MERFRYPSARPHFGSASTYAVAFLAAVLVGLARVPLELGP
jgi:hypothetical protein